MSSISNNPVVLRQHQVQQHKLGAVLPYHHRRLPRLCGVRYRYRGTNISHTKGRAQPQNQLHQRHEHTESRMHPKLRVRITRAGHRNPPAEKLTGRPGPTHILGVRSSAIGTLVERTTRHTMRTSLILSPMIHYLVILCSPTM